MPLEAALAEKVRSKKNKGIIKIEIAGLLFLLIFILALAACLGDDNQFSEALPALKGGASR